MAIRYVVSDLDGTLLAPHSVLSDYTATVLRRAQAEGIGVIIASGRVVGSMMPYVRAIGTKLPIIAGNGALIADPVSGEILRSDPVPALLAREVALLLESERCYFHGYDEEGFFYAAQSEESLEYAEDTGLTGRAVGRLSDYICQDTPKLLAVAPPDTLKELVPRIAERFAGQLAVTSSSARLIEITNRTATKGNALRALGEMLGIDLRETVAFGDGLNDMPLLETAGRGVAVANARSELQRIAAEVCGSNAEDGVAHYIAEHILGSEGA